MKAYLCSFCGVEFYEGHDTCPFCGESISSAKYIGEKKGGLIVESNNNYQESPCDDTTGCTNDSHSSVNTDAPKTINVGEWTNGTRVNYQVKVNYEENGVPPKTIEVRADNTYKQASTALLVLLLGFMSIFFGLVLSIITLVVYKTIAKDTWEDIDRKISKLGVRLAIASIICRVIFWIFGFVSFFIMG